MTNTKDFTKELNELYEHTYKGGDGYNMPPLDNVSTLTTDDGQKYAIGISRKKEELYEERDATPHIESSSIVFVAKLDKQGNLTGDSIRIKAKSAEEYHYSEKYKDRLPLMYRSIDPETTTRINIDINDSKNLPRAERLSDNTSVGNTYHDYTTIINGYFDVTDRSALKRAVKSKKYYHGYEDSPDNDKIKDICLKFLVSDKSDEKYRLEEINRLKRKSETPTKQRIADAKKRFPKHPTKNTVWNLFLKITGRDPRS